MKRIDERFVGHDIEGVGGSLSGGYVGGHEVKEVQRGEVKARVVACLNNERPMIIAKTN